MSIRGFHQGGEGAMLRARVNYSVSICQNVTADVGGNITILKEARDCSFRASAAVMAPQARIVGGTIWCVKGLEVKALGYVFDDKFGYSTDDLKATLGDSGFSNIAAKVLYARIEKSKPMTRVGIAAGVVIGVVAMYWRPLEMIYSIYTN